LRKTLLITGCDQRLCSGGIVGRYGKDVQLSDMNARKVMAALRSKLKVLHLCLCGGSKRWTGIEKRSQSDVPWRWLTQVAKIEGFYNFLGFQKKRCRKSD